MSSFPLIYGFDLVTDAVDGVIDPFHHRVVAIGLSTVSGDELYDGPEDELLRMVDARLSMLSAGVLTSWSGSVVALPFLACRAEQLGIDLDLVLFEDRRSSTPETVEGILHPWLVSWQGHRHLDLQRVYEDDSQDRHRWSLRRNRFSPESLIPAPDPLAKRQPDRNARLARSLAERRWGQAKKVIDRVPDRSERCSVLETLVARN